MADRRVVDLSRGRLVLSMESVNLFDLTRLERNVLSGVLDLLEALEDAQEDERLRFAARNETELEEPDHA